MRGFECMDRKSRDRKTWPLNRDGRCGEVAVSGGSTVYLISTSLWHRLLCCTR